MRDKNINPVYVHLEKGKVSADDSNITFDDIFNTREPTEELEFIFEDRFEPFAQYVHGAYDGIDLVIGHQGRHFSALEVKLTVLPDQTTCRKTEAEWGAELVIRPVTVVYAALSIYHEIKRDPKQLSKAKNILGKAALNVSDWTNIAEVSRKRSSILNALSEFFDKFENIQRPLVMQPVWKTKGKQAALSEHAFDIFVWSNMGLCKMFLQRARDEQPGENAAVSRYLRASARLLRGLYDLLTTDKIRTEEMLRMGLGNQTDKEFSASGRMTNAFMRHARLETPTVKQEILRDLILRGGEKNLSPERRFDATIYFTAAHIFQDEKN